MEVKLSRKWVVMVIAVAAILFLAQAAVAQQVTYNFMPGTDFSKYHTYKWVQIPSNVHPNHIVNQEIIDAINNLLASKGFTLATGDKADLYAGYQCSVDYERQWNAWEWAGDCVGVAWVLPRAPRSPTERLRWISMVRPRNS